MNSRTRKFLSYYQPYRGWLLADLACALLVSATTLLLPLCTRYLTKNVLAGPASNPPGTTGDFALTQIYLVGGVMLLLLLIHLACNLFVDYQGHLMGAKMESDLRSELFEHFQKLSFSFYDEQKTGQLMTRLTNDTFALAELYHHGPEDLVISGLNFVGAFLILIRVNLQLAMIVLVFFPVMAAYTFYFNRRMNLALRKSKDRIGEINAQLEDTLAGIRVVQSFTNENLEKKKFAFANDRFLASRRDGYQSEAYFSAGLIGFTQLMTSVAILFGGVSILQARLDLADLLTFLLCIGILIEPINRFGNFVRLYQEGMTGFDRCLEILEVEPELQSAAGAVELGPVQGHVEFRAVGFKYREDHQEVLKNLSLKITAGEYVALVGTSGVGKTTLCSLIPRFYEVTEGQILLDGRNIRELSLRSLRQQIGIVQQEVYLFAGTVAENIRYGKLEATPAEIVAAAQKANAHEFIQALPNGYETEIGQRGVKLSGGQKQRLSIARVFLKDPPVIIFDEATSALDHESEKAVKDALEQLTNQRTTLVIAHRLSTIRQAHRILVLTDDGITEQGTHAELLALRGVYANLYNSH